MARVASGSVVRQLESLFEGGSATGYSDRQLLERFAAKRDAVGEAAFAALVSRHGPMVLGVCRQILGDRHHAEDAFQAVFLVLARRARSIRDPDLLGNWLYGVALRTARCAKLQLDRRRKQEEDDDMRSAGPGSTVVVEAMVEPADRAAIGREQAEALHDEIGRLPRPFRLPVVLCYFEGLTLDEAARRLRCPVGTMGSRLARAREKLRRGLTRRGVVLAAAALAVVLESRPASASVSSSLCDFTTRAALPFAARQAASGVIPASAAALAQEVLRSMLIHKLKLTALALALFAAIASGAGFVGQVAGRQAGKPDSRERPAGKPDPRPIVAKADEANAKPGRMFVVGRVLDSQGKPVPNASVLVYARTTALHVLDRPEGLAYPTEIGRAKSDDTGRIRVDVPRTALSSHDDFGVVALAPGHGSGWLALDADAEQPVAEITLPPEQIIHGRVFDLSGQPAGNVRVSVTAIRRVVQPHPNPRRARYEGPRFWWAHPDDLPGWPRTVVSDANGRFTLRGVGRGFRAILTVVDPRFVTQVVETETDENSSKKPLAIALQP